MVNTLNVSCRKVYNLFDYVSDLGGIQGSILVFGYTLSAFFSTVLGQVHKAEALFMIPTTQNKECSSTTAMSSSSTTQRIEWFANLTQLRFTLTDKLLLLILCATCFRCKKSFVSLNLALIPSGVSM